MKKMTFTIAVMMLIGMLTVQSIFAQSKINILQDMKNQLYLIEKFDGVKFFGKVISLDDREVLIETEDLGRIYIPKHLIREISPVLVKADENYLTEELFATRYFITTNGLPIKKGENYIQWNLYGPDFQFGVADNFGVGVMTSWAAIPIIGTAKYSRNLGKNTSMALGLLAGTGSWAFPEFGLLLPYVSFTLGDRRNNLTFSTGYGKIFYQEDEYNYNTGVSNEVNRSEGRFLLSIAGLAKINEKFSLVFDSFISPWGPYVTRTEYEYTDHFDPVTGAWTNTTYTTKEITERSPNLAILLPGIRWHLDADRAFQFGFTGFYFDNEFIPAPIPMVQWYRRL
ncbi:MAG: hypothetical protein JXR22_11785 [Prolixibacteraceae bacterium]|nr:hypothetical protein [Prolixibacteraceae bacterium]